MNCTLTAEDREIAAKAADLLEQGHCTGTFARNELSDACDPLGPSAVSWCFRGALMRADMDVSPLRVSEERLDRISRAARQELHHRRERWSSMIAFSDSDDNAQSECVAILRKIAAAPEHVND